MRNQAGEGTGFAGGRSTAAATGSGDLKEAGEGRQPGSEERQHLAEGQVGLVAPGGEVLAEGGEEVARGPEGPSTGAAGLLVEVVDLAAVGTLAGGALVVGQAPRVGVAGYAGPGAEGLQAGEIDGVGVARLGTVDAASLALGGADEL